MSHSFPNLSFWNCFLMLLPEVNLRFRSKIFMIFFQISFIFPIAPLLFKLYCRVSFFWVSHWRQHFEELGLKEKLTFADRKAESSLASHHAPGSEGTVDTTCNSFIYVNHMGYMMYIGAFLNNRIITFLLRDL